MDSALNSLCHKGLYLKREWAERIVKESSSVDIESNLFSAALKTDLRECSSGLPLHIFSKENTYSISSSMILQIESIVNIASPKDSQFVDTSNRLLKMKLTDGVNDYYGIEYSPIPSLSVTMKKGTKIAIHTVQMVNGLLLLNETNTLVLGLLCICETHTSIKKRQNY